MVMLEQSHDFQEMNKKILNVDCVIESIGSSMSISVYSYLLKIILAIVIFFFLAFFGLHGHCNY